jgi:hypothetical protein
MSRSLYYVQRRHTSSICTILLGLLITAEPASLYYMYSLILNRFLNPSNQPFNHFSSLILLNCDKAAHSSLALVFKILQ